MGNNLDKNLDLSSPERKILASLYLSGTLAEISKRLNLPRSTVGYNLGKLQSKKFITFKLNGKRKYYSLAIRNSKKNNANETISLSSPILKLGPITIYKGARAIEILWQEVAQQPNESRLTGVQPRKSFHEAIKKSSKNIVQNVSQAITDKRFIFDAIVHDDMARAFFTTYKKDDAKSVARAFTGRLEDIVKVEPHFLDEKAEMFIIGNFSFFIDWFNEIAIKIENQNINHLLSALYHSAKVHGQRYEQGKHIESIIKLESLKSLKTKEKNSE